MEEKNTCLLTRSRTAEVSTEPLGVLILLAQSPHPRRCCCARRMSMGKRLRLSFPYCFVLTCIRKHFNRKLQEPFDKWGPCVDSAGQLDEPGKVKYETVYCQSHSARIHGNKDADYTCGTVVRSGCINVRFSSSIRAGGGVGEDLLRIQWLYIWMARPCET